MKLSSSQVTAGIGGALLGGLSVAALSENPTFIKVLGGAVLLGSVAVATAKPLKK
ncbi:hypothetical protein L1077_16615 [Pseudoalteromonas luteoviolacea]|uniref:hypothetical protein n=1 Tax=Pseudoalteromonas luteoviolacea TaxID=43657 RepID=UPI001F15C4C1|nr:hypothetical protein [Pseudoalteromonas luteoviolacea]MCF6441061.1 hypothetical protein [Pseudoalteromonas luteoviolacea]